MRLQFRRREEPDVNLTPLIDVVFLLLIFFMVSTTFERETEISIELPEASGPALQGEKRVVEISIDEKGRYFVNRQEVINTQPETLKRAIAAAAGDEQKPRVILSADRNTPHQSVISAMDVARQLGFVNLTFATSKPAEGN
ncbi:MAG: biopolymer transporter ExbD [Gammaproteobacteria bacterium]|nr:biopolymer transporter ExbD [Gammaproteobacteria bacterium]MCW8840409.1 biopolymer transporter ExbD [Gammaproteobacteria bacterium]MCW8928541.1 biopolymer transporter ExbD [Gammaproteobacteria bacterium]MCW8957590.1 biopolymer transporter ExbD [Gammaproteobacteria bacterium]MCW8973640.1 biopolymer transporter ExbD [Gammaproteobacteria bacterium]